MLIFFLGFETLKEKKKENEVQQVPEAIRLFPVQCRTGIFWCLALHGGQTKGIAASVSISAPQRSQLGHQVTLGHVPQKVEAIARSQSEGKFLVQNIKI